MADPGILRPSRARISPNGSFLKVARDARCPKLVLNRDLIRASIQSIDYVIIHELAHAIEPDHGVGWQALMKRLLPDWKERKIELETRLL